MGKPKCSVENPIKTTPYPGADVLEMTTNTISNVQNANDVVHLHLLHVSLVTNFYNENVYYGKDPSLIIA